MATSPKPKPRFHSLPTIHAGHPVSFREIPVCFSHLRTRHSPNRTGFKESNLSLAEDFCLPPAWLKETCLTFNRIFSDMPSRYPCFPKKSRTRGSGCDTCLSGGTLYGGRSCSGGPTPGTHLVLFTPATDYHLSTTTGFFEPSALCGMGCGLRKREDGPVTDRAFLTR